MLHFTPPAPATFTWHDLDDGGVLDLDAPDVELRITVEGGRARAEWIESQSGAVLGVPVIGEA